LGDLEAAADEAAELGGGEETIGKKDDIAIIEFPIYISAMEQ